MLELYGIYKRIYFTLGSFFMLLLKIDVPSPKLALA